MAEVPKTEVEKKERRGYWIDTSHLIKSKKLRSRRRLSRLELSAYKRESGDVIHLEYEFAEKDSAKR